MMDKTLKLEEAAQLLLSCYLLYLLPLELAWWLWVVLFFAPDLGMIGYAINPKVGAAVYNIFHFKLLAIAIGIWGFIAGNVQLQAAGLLLYAHASFDRMLGFGLKYPDAFKNTHLGKLP